MIDELYIDKQYSHNTVNFSWSSYTGQPRYSVANNSLFIYSLTYTHSISFNGDSVPGRLEYVTGLPLYI